LSTRSGGFFVHQNGICESKNVGAGTRISAFAHIFPQARLGRDCNICDHVSIENDVIVGDRVTVASGVQLGDGIRLGNDVFVGPNATFTRDRLPCSKGRPDHVLETIVEDGASIGVNATILSGLRIGTRAMIGAGAVVTRSVPANAVAAGNPAVIIGYLADALEPAQPADWSDPTSKTLRMGVADCALWRLRNFEDMRGQLTAIEFDTDLPFVPKRSFIVHSVPSREFRGGHAHIVCALFLVAVHGRVNIVIDDGRRRRDITLEGRSTGLYMSPMVWGIQYKFNPDTVLMVLASHASDPADYVRDYEAFLALVGASPSARGGEGIA
jgi:acetyltransferase-like isoleucine patch superfamily enzyme